MKAEHLEDACHAVSVIRAGPRIRRSGGDSKQPWAAYVKSVCGERHGKRLTKPILRAVLPALQAAQQQTQFGTGLRPPGSRRYGFLDQLQVFKAIWGVDYSSSSLP